MTQTPPENKNVQPGLNDGSIYMKDGITKRAEKRKSGVKKFALQSCVLSNKSPNSHYLL